MIKKLMQKKKLDDANNEYNKLFLEYNQSKQ